MNLYLSVDTHNLSVSESLSVSTVDTSQSVGECTVSLYVGGYLIICQNVFRYLSVCASQCLYVSDTQPFVMSVSIL